jgi:hypothetical protein
MITPLGQRQMFQTVNAEAVRAALEVAGLAQREEAQKQVLADRMAEDKDSVPEIPQAERLKTEERHQGRRGQQQPGQREAGEGDGSREEPDGSSGWANLADTHMDFLA